MPVVSIIIPIYNSDKYLYNCLNSILNQTFKDIEILCIDDCSTDDSLRILEEFHNLDSRVKVFKQPYNQKQGAARNIGIKNSNGKYITFIDSDDFIENNYIEIMLNKMEETNCDLVIGNIANFAIDNTQNIQNQLFMLNESYKKQVLEDGLYEFDLNASKRLRTGPVCKLYRRDIIINNNIYFPEKLIQEDEAFYWFYMTKIKNIYYINKVLYHRQIHPNSAMYQLKFSNKHIFDYLCIIKSIYKYLKKENLYDKYSKTFKKYIVGYINFIQNPLIKLIYIFSINNYIPILQELLCKNIQEYITLKEYIKNNKKKKIMFWGASNNLKSFLKLQLIKPKNILGIIDKNPNQQGKDLYSYPIYSPNILGKITPEIIICTIKNNNEYIYKDISKFLKENYPNIQLLPNIYL